MRERRNVCCEETSSILVISVLSSASDDVSCHQKHVCCQEGASRAAALRGALRIWAPVLFVQFVVSCNGRPTACLCAICFFEVIPHATHTHTQTNCVGQSRHIAFPVSHPRQVPKQASELIQSQHVFFFLKAYLPL